MIIQLINKGVAVLTARTNHTQYHSKTPLPVIYEGDTSLLPSTLYPDDTWDLDILETIFTNIAHEHGLEIKGDYVNMLHNGSVDFTGYPPEPGYVKEPWEAEEENQEHQKS